MFGKKHWWFRYETLGPNNECPCSIRVDLQDILSITRQRRIELGCNVKFWQPIVQENLMHLWIIFRVGLLPVLQPIVRLSIEETLNNEVNLGEAQTVSGAAPSDVLWKQVAWQGLGVTPYLVQIQFDSWCWNQGTYQMKCHCNKVDLLSDFRKLIDWLIPVQFMSLKFTYSMAET